MANEELEAQTQSLQVPEARLKDKQAILDEQNQELKAAQQALETKTYKGVWITEMISVIQL